MTQSIMPYFKPDKVREIRCKCGELQLRIYPWSSFNVTNAQAPLCKRCLNKQIKESNIKSSLKK